MHAWTLGERQLDYSVILSVAVTFLTAISRMACSVIKITTKRQV